MSFSSATISLRTLRQSGAHLASEVMNRITAALSITSNDLLMGECAKSPRLRCLRDYISCFYNLHVV